MMMFVRTPGDPRSLVQAARREIATLAPGVPLYDVRPMQERVADAMAYARFSALLLATFAVVALALAALGTYGVISFGVSQRRTEIGVRVALGATSHQVVGMFLRSGIIVIGVGIPAGFVAAIIAARQLQSLVFGIAVTDRATLGAVAVVLVAITLIASYLPARSAARVDPLNALRAE